MIMKFNLMKKYNLHSSNEDFEIEEKEFTPGIPGTAEQTEQTEALGIDTTPIEGLFNDLEIVSTEAGFVGNLTNYFAKKSINLNISIREGFKYLTTWNYDPMLKLNPSQMANFVNHLDYLQLEDMIVDQPVGFNGELLDYVTGLVQRAKVMEEIVTKVIQPATSRFGHYLTIPEDRAERRNFEFGIDINADLDSLIKADAKYFSTGRSSTTKFGNLFGSLNDFVMTERLMTEINTILKGGQTSTIKAAVDALSLTATSLVSRLDKDTKPSKEFAKMISEELAQVAKWVEWYSVQMTKIIETNNVLAKIEKDLRDWKPKPIK